jgi:hypothetical protein
LRIGILLVAIPDGISILASGGACVTDELDDTEAVPRRPLTRTQRWLFALVAVFGVWFIASVALVIAGQVSGSTPVQYLLGTLVVLLMLVMLVILFIILWPVLRGERTEDETAVLAMVAHDFPAIERPAALALLDDYAVTVPEAERARVQRALLTLCGGNLARLRYFTEEARQDYHDLLTWADETTAPTSGMERDGPAGM